MNKITPQETGKRGEALGEAFLKKRGFKILERNVKTPIGEIDLVARDGKMLVFVEVKTRRSREFGLPQEAVGAAKQRRLSRLASWYLMERKLESTPVRFDVLAIQFSDTGPSLELIENAFEAAH